MKYSGCDVFILGRDAFIRNGLYHLCLDCCFSDIFIFNRINEMEVAIYRSLLVDDHHKRRVIILSFECGDDGPVESPYLLERLGRCKDSIELYLLIPQSAYRIKLIYKSCNNHVRFLCKKDSLVNLRGKLSIPPPPEFTGDVVKFFTFNEKEVFFKFLNNPHLPCNNRVMYMRDYATFSRIACKLGMKNQELREYLCLLNLKYI
ncbi:hypothetical protein [Enterobacter cloacae]|uniref:hypothetical protein n=1 Tax=Enterobacter cloacae TaxID=550 RepID=UPI00101B15C1|nr:hypothetical protein [Enterobacter cloacae]QBC02765.1 hypothetical protein EWI30_12065 [Enterobacter cloacae]